MLLPTLYLALANPATADLTAVLESEIHRTMEYLAGTPAQPYFLAYRVDDTQTTNLEASHGGLTHHREDPLRTLVVTVRVGSPALDNSHTMRGEKDATLMEVRRGLLTLDGPDRGIQAQVWGATQRALRDAQDRLQRVLQTQTVQVPEIDRSGDFRPEPPHQWNGPAAKGVLDAAAWATRLPPISTLLAEDPQIEGGEARLNWQRSTSTLVNSEGSRIRQERSGGTVTLTAYTTAPDGALLWRSEARFATEPSQLPDQATLRELASQIHTDLGELRAAPLGEPYAGPVLLSGAAAAVLLHELIGHNSEGDLVKDESGAQTFRDARGTSLLPRSFIVYDDPRLTQYSGTPLAGNYVYDDEGVPAERVDLIVDGVLRAFLLSRSPVDGAPRSNGHGRAPLGGSAGPRTGNLILESRAPKSPEDLRAELRRLAREQGLEAGIYVETIHGGEAQVGRAEANTFQIETEQVWRVYTDGRPDTRVRGLDLVGTPLLTLRQVVEAGDDPQVLNGMCGKGDGHIPTSIISPSLLLRAAELQRAETTVSRPPILPKPARSGRS
jgi:predicted Zn-dependent protease